MEEGTAIESRLNELESLRNKGVISDDEYQEARRAALGLPPLHQLAPEEPEYYCRNGHKMSRLQVDPSHRDHHVLCRYCLQYQQIETIFSCKQCVAEFACSACLEKRVHLSPLIKQYHSSLTDCGKERGSCLDSICCMYCFISQLQSAMHGFVDFSQPEPPFYCCSCLSICHIGCMLVFDLLFLGIGSWCAAAQLRNRVEDLFQMDQSSCCDSFVASLFCRCCVAAQVHRELTARRYYPGGICCSKNPQKLTQVAMM